MVGPEYCTQQTGFRSFHEVKTSTVCQQTGLLRVLSLEISAQSTGHVKTSTVDPADWVTQRIGYRKSSLARRQTETVVPAPQNCKSPLFLCSRHFSCYNGVPNCSLSSSRALLIACSMPVGKPGSMIFWSRSKRPIRLAIWACRASRCVIASGVSSAKL